MCTRPCIEGLELHLIIFAFYSFLPCVSACFFLLLLVGNYVLTAHWIRCLTLNKYVLYPSEDHVGQLSLTRRRRENKKSLT